MSEITYLLLAAVLGYIWGAIPFGYLYVKAVKGIDLRQVGSGRTGGTNSLRAAGFKVGVVTAISDVIKGALPVFIVRWLLGDTLGLLWLPWVEVTAGVMAVVGHNWSVFLHFGGGAGTGPNVGWATAVWWPMAAVGAVVVGVLMWIVGMASVASLTMAVLIPLTFAILYTTFPALLPVHSPAYFIAGIASALVVAWSLRPNIKRLLSGTERVVGPAARRQKRRQEWASR